MAHNFSLEDYQKVLQSMAAVNTSYCDDRFQTRVRDYSLKEVEDILESGTPERLQRLSWNYFWKDGFYKRILMYYSTLLTYAGVLIPTPISGKKLSEPALQKKFNNALNYVENIQLPRILQQITLNALIYGSYYGVVKTATKEDLVILDLPPRYCRARAKDIYGRDIVEFNTSYFNSISNLALREEVLNTYPKELKKAYKAAEKTGSYWIELPPEIGICFSLVDGNRPLFASVIPATIKYDMAVDLERERDLDEIRKIIVQTIPHLSDGTLLFETPEAEVMHKGAVEMLQSNPNVSVLTSYADVTAITSHTNGDVATNKLEKNQQNIYSNAGVSGELFAPTGSQSLKSAIENDTALMMILANKYSYFISSIINNLFGGSIIFKYTILPVTYYNRSDYITDTFKLAQSGYSFLLPSIAAGITQRDLLSLKYLENDVMKLTDVLKPLSSAYTQSAKGEAGRPTKDVEDKSPRTIQNEESLNNQ